MDLFFDATDPTAVADLRSELATYLGRHAEPGSDLAGAEIAVGELLANAVRHAPGPAWVHVDWSERRPRIDVHDLGPGFELKATLPEDPLATGGRGLFIVSEFADQLAAAAKRAGGSKVSAVLPVRRPVEQSHDPPRIHRDALPSAEEVDADGTFGREPFLRALVVELARAVERHQGPDVAEAMVAQVGASVGGRMEEEYRGARRIVDRLTPAQTADLYVRLKAAIGGDFYVIDADEERIVLGNRACPFGQVVTRAPGLCRMTSSVFGGIAARNFGRAAVALEERIAVGDRVPRWLCGWAPPSAGAGKPRTTTPATRADGGRARVSAGGAPHRLPDLPLLTARADRERSPQRGSARPEGVPASSDSHH